MRNSMLVVGLLSTLSPVVAHAATPAELTAAAKKLAVTNAATYQPIGSTTKCNLFVKDFAKEILGATPTELNGTANIIFDNLSASGDWTKYLLSDVNAAFAAAQDAANHGKFVLIAYKNPGGHGHIGVGVPSQESGGSMQMSGQWGTKVPFIAQAGAAVFEYKMMSCGFKPAIKADMAVFIKK